MSLNDVSSFGSDLMSARNYTGRNSDVGVFGGKTGNNLTNLHPGNQTSRPNSNYRNKG
jgi:hypothetical protein